MELRENQTNRSDVPRASRRFITLLNAFNKVVARLRLRWLHGVAMFMCLHNTYHFCRVCLLSSVCSILATAPRYCVLLHERQLVQYDEGGKKEKKNTGPIPKSVAREVEGSSAAGSRPRFHPRPVLRVLPLRRTCRWHRAPRFHLR